jgi:DNA invertase Pin-like site-specific DNA recombinase
MFHSLTDTMSFETIIVTMTSTIKPAPSKEQKAKLLKAKIAVALHDELGRVPKQDVFRQITSGKLVFHIFGSLAEFERELIRERTQAGLEAARSRGRVGGRPRTLDTKKAGIAQALYNDKKHSVAEICKTLGISRATLYRSVKAKAGEKAYE